MATSKVKFPGVRAVVIRKAQYACLDCGKYTNSDIQVCVSCQQRRYQEAHKLALKAFRRKVFGK